jgi:redox-sensitive bicupin YhaK (pirin superfamily)
MNAPTTGMRIAQKLTVQPLRHGTGFHAQGIRGSDAAMDPFLMADHYRMSQPTFGPHPHAGFSAVTYMFDDAETGFHNRDSRGDNSRIGPGDLHWTTAGAGMMHDEVPEENGKVAHGLQLFVNLAACDKHMPPGVIRIAATDMPRVTQAGGATVKVAFGAYADDTHSHAAVRPLPTDVTLLDVSMQANQTFTYPVPAGRNAFMFVVRGAVTVAGQTVQEGEAVSFGREGGALEVATAKNTAEDKSDRKPKGVQLALFMGVPLNEPVVRHGPFAMTNAADIERAMADYQQGRMGQLA